MNHDYYKYGRYLQQNQETRWATADEIRNSGCYIDLSAPTYPSAGLPILSDGKEAYVDDKDTHSLIFGATGSKKTRLFCMPMINFFTKAGESFVATDPKGELYARTSGLAKKMGYKTVVLNFRDIGNGDYWNPLALPYEMYHSSNREMGIAMLNDFVATLAEPQMKDTDDPFWPQMASSLALGNLLLLAECGKKDEMNVTSLANLCNMEHLKHLKDLSSHMDSDSIAGLNYRGVFSAAPASSTIAGIYGMLYSMLRVFTAQKSLSDMLSHNTFDVRMFGREKTAVYIIVPDEKTTYHFLVTTFIKQAYELLIAEAQKESDYKLPVRVNFVLDEFCNIPRIPDMPSMISAARSRNMRYYLVVQSMHQLKGKYGEDADTIKGNCDNWVFLTSRELLLLNEISELCGTVCTADGRQRRLISVSELQRLDKERGEALILHARQYPVITEMADIDSYEMFKGYAPAQMGLTEVPNAKVFSLPQLMMDLTQGKRIYYPFSTKMAVRSSKEKNPFDF